MLELFKDVELSNEAASWMAQGLRALASCDGLHTSELALVEAFERELGLDPTDPADFSASANPLTGDTETELFVRSLQLMALADGRISAKEDEWIAGVAGALGVADARRAELAVESKKFLLGSLAGVSAFRAQAEQVGRSLGLSDADIASVLGPAE
jgi:uncharacterized tellurite resistance protein B-like protein